MGIKAAFTFDPAKDAETNVQAMTEALDDVKCGQITTAVRDTKMDGFNIKSGDIIGLDGKKIIARASNPTEAAKTVIKKMVDDFSEVITLYYGESVTFEEAEALKTALEEEYEDFDVLLYEGGQPHYQYFISIE